ncbi:MAG: UDP-3-O-(3-hydroxymyristoyl)glucosamine N-acyltransferase [Candidatus Hydrogenedentes bacterium]|nr:UDP-3-O-(3-hydroxymyristoyl)glucosamine N-acyltransferase [Candidatus Hydrogenedentota bacterium]
MKLTVEQIAQLVGGTIQGNPALTVTGVNGLSEAKAGDLTFARSAKHFPQLRDTAASAALVPVPVDKVEITTICVEHPDVAFLMVLQQFASEPPRPCSGIHEMAYIASDAILGENIAVGPFVCVESGAVIGDNAILYSGVYIGHGCKIGNGTLIYPNAVIRESCEIGERCVIHAGACIGSDGFGFAPIDGQWQKIPQTGTVSIGDDVEIGSSTAVDRATFGVTRIGTGTKIDNLVQIGHNVIIGEHCAVAGTTGIAGSAVIGDRVRIGADSGIVGHITIGDDVTVGGRSGVVRSIDAGKVVSGFPAVDHNTQRRVLVAQQRTPEMLRRLAQIERRLKEFEELISHETTDNS